MMNSTSMLGLLCPLRPTAVAFALAAFPLVAAGETTPRCVGSTETECRYKPGAGTSVVMPIGENAEVAPAASASLTGGPGFSITIDNTQFAGVPQALVPERRQDIALADANVDVRFDGLMVTPRLNVATVDLSRSAQADAPVTFRASTNYPNYISRAEIRILDKRARRGAQLVDRVAVAANGTVDWVMPQGGSGDFAYVLRVYDAKGRYNETRALPLTRTDGDIDPADLNGTIIAAGEGEDQTARRNFAVRGGAITVHGDRLEPGQAVRVMGYAVPVDGSGAFVTQRILPVGQHVVDVNIEQGVQTRGQTLTRDVEVPESDVFYVAIVDITASEEKTTFNSGATARNSRVNGRIAGYFKGRYPGGVEVTASIDTGDGPLSEAFNRLDEKDPLSVLQRLRDDTFYPTYGDESTAFDDAPSRGRFYLKVENETSSAMWGDFEAGVTGTVFVNDTRSLYGALVTHRSSATHDDGTPVLEFRAYAAEGDTVARRDVLEGTGGSAYFLSHQDIEAGSETVSVEIVDATTGRVRSIEQLTPGRDYSIDPIQGVLILTAPLSRGASDGALVQSNPAGDDIARLVVTYAQTPALGSVDGGSYGARATWAVSERLSLGLTGAVDTTGVEEHRVLGLDLRYDLAERSWIELEAARSEGPGFESRFSNDGGLTIGTDTAVGAADRSAHAYRLDAYFALSDMGLENDGFVSIYAERIEGGFASRSHNVDVTQTLVGLEGEFALSTDARLHFAAESFRKANGEETNEAEIVLRQRLSAATDLDLGLSWLDQTRPATRAETGTATYLVARVSHAFSDDMRVFGYARHAIAHSGALARDNRYGLGAEVQINEALRFTGEVSDGTRGFGAAVGLTWSPAPGREIYVRYSEGGNLSGGGSVSGRDLVFGAKRRHSDRVSTYAESVWRDSSDETSLTRIYGVTYTPSDAWTLSGQIETGEVRDAAGGDFDRFAFSTSVSYDNGEDFSAFARLEYRHEEGAGTARDRETWLLSAAFDYRTDPSWHLLGSIDLLHSDSDEGDFRNGDYTRVSLGYAYRPVEDDRTNALVKLTYINDQPGEDQVSADGSVDGDRQRSLVFSADVIHELTETVTLGAKYGYRKGESAPRGTDAFTSNDAHLAVLRVDCDVSHNWALHLEGRAQFDEPSGDVSRGGSIAVYRDIGNSVMVGVGYEVGNVSADLTASSYRERGLFLNVIAKF